MGAGPRAAVGGIGSFEVIPDTALSPDIEASSSLILVGWPDENSALARLAPKLPVAIKGRKISIEGALAPGAGLLLAYPNPEAPGRLLGVVALPMGGKAATDYARALIAPIAGSGSQSELGGYATPDVIELDGAGHALWMGSFDWRWGKLTRIEAGQR
jgi:hypothetical protein